MPPCIHELTRGLARFSGQARSAGGEQQSSQRRGAARRAGQGCLKLADGGTWIARLQQRFAIQLHRGLDWIGAGVGSWPGRFKPSGSVEGPQRRRPIAGLRLHDANQLESHDLGNLAIVGIGCCFDRPAHVVDRGRGPGGVSKFGAGHAQREQLVHVVESRALLHVGPAPAFNDETRAQRGEFVLERDRSEAPADLAFDVRVQTGCRRRRQCALNDSGQLTSFRKSALLEIRVLQPCQAVEILLGSRCVMKPHPFH